MQPALYFASGEILNEEAWCHFALHIPYYTHFTSPIRRYADLMVHRLLQSSLEQEEEEEQARRQNSDEFDGNGENDKKFDFHQNLDEVQAITKKCNEMTMASKKAQERSDVIWLSVFLKSNPIASTLAVVVSMGQKSFSVLVPSLGLESR